METAWIAAYAMLMMGVACSRAWSPCGERFVSNRLVPYTDRALTNWLGPRGVTDSGGKISSLSGFADEAFGDLGPLAEICIQTLDTPRPTGRSNNVARSHR